MTNELRECTEDWIMESFIKDDPTYGCDHKAWHWSKLSETWHCVFCGKERAITLTQEEHEWLLSLCSGRQG